MNEDQKKKIEINRKQLEKMQTLSELLCAYANQMEDGLKELRASMAEE